MPTFKDKKHLLDIAETIHCYLGQKSPDCILYSQDGFEYPVHKVIAGLLNFIFFCSNLNQFLNIQLCPSICIGVLSVSRPVPIPTVVAQNVTNKSCFKSDKYAFLVTLRPLHRGS